MWAINFSGLFLRVFCPVQMQAYILGGGGGGYFSTVCGTGTCHFLGVLFQTVTELWVPFSQFLDISRNYGCPFQGIFDNFRNYGPRYSFDLWNYGPKIQQNLRNYGYQFFGQNGTSPSHKRLSYPPPELISLHKPFK